LNQINCLKGAVLTRELGGIKSDNAAQSLIARQKKIEWDKENKMKSGTRVCM